MENGSENELSANPDTADAGDVEWADDLNSDDISELLGFDLSSEEGADRSGLRALINSALISHRRLPMLDVIFDRTARLMTTSLRQLTNDNVEVSLDDVSSTRFGDFLQSVSSPSVVGVLKAPKLDNYALIVADAGLVYSVVDLLLGGRRGGGVAGAADRGFTTIELALTQRVLSLLASDLTMAFQPVADVEFIIDRLETTPRFAAVAQDASVCSLAKFRVDIDDRGGRVTILTPHATLEPIYKTLLREFIGEATANEDLWRSHLSAEVNAAQINLDIVLAEKEITLGELEAFAPGQTLRFNTSAAAPVEIRAGGAVVARGRAGRAGDNIAIRVGEPEPLKQLASGEAA